jgi:hypothetical protein
MQAFKLVISRGNVCEVYIVPAETDHMPVASNLAPLIDSKQISVEGMMTSSNLSGSHSRYGQLGMWVHYYMLVTLTDRASATCRSLALAILFVGKLWSDSWFGLRQDNADFKIPESVK